jgi:hypothetical protein
MKTTLQFHDDPLGGDDRLMDALLREHARAGTNADDVFLTRLTASLDAESAESARITTLPVTPARPRHRLAWSLGLAASVALAAGLLWKSPPASKAPSGQVAVLARASGIPLHTELPPELIEGTPKPINVPRLVPAPAKAPEFMVPAGTVLLSKGKKVTGSDDNPIIGTLDLITDGDKDAGEGYFVELLDGLQWVQIDLEKSAAIHAIWLWHFHSQKRAYHDVIVRISDDPEFKTGVTTVFNNDYDNSAQLGKATDNPYVETRFGLIVDGKGTKGRYVRLYSNGNTSNEMNHYIEVEVFGISG